MGFGESVESGAQLCSLSVELLRLLMGKVGAMDGPKLKSCCPKTSRH